MERAEVFGERAWHVGGRWEWGNGWNLRTLRGLVMRVVGEGEKDGILWPVLRIEAPKGVPVEQEGA